MIFKIFKVVQVVAQILAVLLMEVGSPCIGYAAPVRNSTVKRDFQRANPCPSTGKTKGACPGYVKDHIKPLACGGADAVDNLQWQTKEEAKKEDKWERVGCVNVTK